MPSLVSVMKCKQVLAGLLVEEHLRGDSKSVCNVPTRCARGFRVYTRPATLLKDML